MALNGYKHSIRALADVAQLIAHCPAKQKVASPIPGPGICLDYGFDPQSGHMPRLWVWSPVKVCMRGS